MLKLILLGIGFMLVFEGLIYFLFARNMQNYLLQLSKIEPHIINTISVTMFILGLCLIYYILRFYGDV